MQSLAQKTLEPTKGSVCMDNEAGLTQGLAHLVCSQGQLCAGSYPAFGDPSLVKLKLCPWPQHRRALQVASIGLIESFGPPSVKMFLRDARKTIRHAGRLPSQGLEGDSAHVDCKAKRCQVKCDSRVESEMFCQNRHSLHGIENYHSGKEQLALSNRPRSRRPRNLCGLVT